MTSQSEKKYSSLSKVYHPSILAYIPQYIQKEYVHVKNLHDKLYLKVTDKEKDYSIDNIRTIYCDKIQHIETKKYYFLKLCTKESKIISNTPVKYVSEAKMFEFFKKYPHDNVLCPIYADFSQTYYVYLYDYYSYDLFEAQKFCILKKNKKAFVLKQVLSVLQHLHKHNIGYGDLKPENIMLTDRKIGTVKVIDFETCIQFSDEKDYVVWSECRITPEYMSPEFMTSSIVSLKTDTWTYGCVCYELLALSLPYKRYEHSGLLILDKYNRLKQYNLTDDTYKTLLTYLDFSPEERPYISDITIS